MGWVGENLVHINHSRDSKLGPHRRELLLGEQSLPTPGTWVRNLVALRAGSYCPWTSIVCPNMH